MITLYNGDKYRINVNDPETLEGYTLVDKTFIQDFKPCVYRVISSCKKCPKSNKRPTCSLKGIDSHLTCVGCLERNEGPR